MKKYKTQKGQAAITDALFFLLIIVTLSVLLFRYSSTYGQKIDKASNDLYFKEYTNSVLRTVFYISVPLDFNLDVQNAKETDYLMAQIKQNFYGNEERKIGYSDLNKLSREDFRDVAKYNLFHTIKATMIPLNSHDFVFYLHNKEEDNFFFFMIKRTNFECGDKPIGKFENLSDCNINLKKPAIYYLCDPKEGYFGVRKVLAKSPNLFSTTMPLTFEIYREPGNKTQNTFLTIATFAIWPATVDITTDDLKILNCNEIEDI